MIRKGIIVVLTLAGVASFCRTFDTGQVHLGYTGFLSANMWLYLHSGGRLDIGIWYDNDPVALITAVGRDLERFGQPHGVYCFRGETIEMPRFKALWDHPHSVYNMGNQTIRIRVTQISCPHWTLSILLISYPFFAFIRGPLRKYRRRRKGLCIHCGYNLTGNTTGICSECGAEIPL